MTSVWRSYFARRFSFTAEGKVAPPMPTIPASATLAAISSGVAFSGRRRPSRGPQLSCPSVRMVMVGMGSPEGWGAAKWPTAITRPEVGACMLAETGPRARPISWPFTTRSSRLTSGSASAPICCWSGTRISVGIGMSSMGLSELRCLRVSGWTPPRMPKNCEGRKRAAKWGKLMPPPPCPRASKAVRGLSQYQLLRVFGFTRATMASVGQASMQALQPMQASVTTVWICLFAPMIASVGQRLKQRMQPVQWSSKMKATVGSASAMPGTAPPPPSVSTMAASASATSRPPGAQAVTGAAPSDMASARPRQPG